MTRGTPTRPVGLDLSGGQDRFDWLVLPMVILHSSAQKGTTSSASYNNQPEHQRKMPRGFCGRSPHFRRLSSGGGGYSVTYRFITIRSSVGAAGAASTHHKAINMAME